MRAVILGAHGQLGSALAKCLPEGTLAWSRYDVDAGDQEHLRRKLAEVGPSYLVNCTAYNFVDKAETEREAAFQANAWSVRNMAKLCAELDCCFVHISSDFVFGADILRTTPYTEEDTPGPVSVYGESKLAGERFAREFAPKHLVVRTCGLYGTRTRSGGKGTNFVETMLRFAKEGKPLKVVNDQHCTPSSAADVAAAIADLMACERTGLFNVVNRGATTWYEFAKTIFEMSEMTPNLSPISAADYANQFPPEKRPANRPAYSVLSLDKFARTGLKLPPIWQDGLRRYLFDERKNGCPA